MIMNTGISQKKRTFSTQGTNISFPRTPFTEVKIIFYNLNWRTDLLIMKQTVKKEETQNEHKERPKN
jgi:hypothetical protein